MGGSEQNLSPPPPAPGPFPYVIIIIMTIDRESPVGLSPIFPGVLYVKTYAYIYIIYTKNDT